MTSVFAPARRRRACRRHLLALRLSGAARGPGRPADRPDPGDPRRPPRRRSGAVQHRRRGGDLPRRARVAAHDARRRARAGRGGRGQRDREGRARDDSLRAAPRHAAARRAAGDPDQRATRGRAARRRVPRAHVVPALPKVRPIAPPADGGVGAAARDQHHPDLRHHHADHRPQGRARGHGGAGQPADRAGPPKARLPVDISRSGSASVYGESWSTARAATTPVFVARGIGVYPEIASRHSAFCLSPEQAAAMRGPVRVELRDPMRAAAR